jgi:hypothetical protein
MRVTIYPSIVEELRTGNTCFSDVVSVHGRMWGNIMKDCLVSHPVEGWEEVAQWSVNQLTGDGLKTRLCKLSLGAVIYHASLDSSK